MTADRTRTPARQPSFGDGPSLSRLLLVLGSAIIAGGACLAFVWHTLNSLGIEPVEPWRLLAAGLAIVGLLAVIGLVYRYLSALSSS